MNKKLKVIVVGAVLVAVLVSVPRQANAFWGIGDVVYLIMLVHRAETQIAQLKQTYGLFSSQYQALKSLPQRYQAQFTSMLSFHPRSDAYGNLGGITGVMNLGTDPTAAYGQVTSAMGVPQIGGLPPDMQQRIKASTGYVQLTDGGIQGLMQAVGQQRYNSQRIQQQISNLQSDSLADGQTALQVAQHQSAAGVLMLQQSRDTANTQMLIAQQAAITAMREREQLVESTNTLIASQQSLSLNVVRSNDAGALQAPYQF